MEIFNKASYLAKLPSTGPHVHKQTESLASILDHMNIQTEVSFIQMQATSQEFIN